MKKKITFSILNYFEDSGKDVAKLQMGFKTISAMIVASAWFTASEKHALIANIACAIINELFAFIKIEEIKTP